MESFRHR